MTFTYMILGDGRAYKFEKIIYVNGKKHIVLIGIGSRGDSTKIIPYEGDV